MVVRPGPAAQHIALLGDIPPHAYPWGTGMPLSVEHTEGQIVIVPGSFTASAQPSEQPVWFCESRASNVKELKNSFC